MKTKTPLSIAKEEEKLEYFFELFESSQAKEKSPTKILEAALTMMDFGGLTPKQVLDFIEATGR